LVYFGDLGWRSVGAIGNPSVFTFENDIGPDGANHDRTGVFAMTGSPGQPTGEVEGLNLVDVGPTILSLYGIQEADGSSRSFL
jgi:predicted AlkP superfamily phosphohydrolase/phosphomutase